MKTIKKDLSKINEIRIVDQIRSLGIDMIDKAKSGHPGIVLGAAPILYTLYAKVLRVDPKVPNFFNRDRFVLSAGHGSALLYATLYMAGYDISLDDLKKFRQASSITPGHPEYGVTPGVDMTTGPLGQGFATAVGMAMAEVRLRSIFNKGKRQLIDYYTYVLCSDGDLMEGVSYEAASLAGRLGLNKLIVLYDSNDVCLDGKTSLTFQENISMRFISMGWNVITVTDGNDPTLIERAIVEAKKSTDKPTLIEVKTTIGKYSLLEGTSQVHGTPLTKEDITSLKTKLKVRDIPFAISKDCREDFSLFIEERSKDLVSKWDKKCQKLSDEEKQKLSYYMGEDKSILLNDLIYEVPEEKKESPRITSEKVLNSVAKNSDFLFGGSADLFATNKTYIKDGGDFEKSNPAGKNIYFGVREHVMGAILNGLSLCGFRAYGSTFLSFTDYMRPAIRLAAMMGLANIYICTHDSISVGEDGPTHQPVEQIASFRAMPNIEVFRPADANEVIGSYKTILENNIKTPSILCLSRNKLPILESTKVQDVSLGGYVVYDPEVKATGILIATGEEVSIALEVSEQLKTKGMNIRVVSMPCMERFKRQDPKYIDEVLPVEIRKIVIEAASSMSWNEFVFHNKYILTLDQFGKSGKREDVYKHFGFDVSSLTKKVEKLLK